MIRAHALLPRSRANGPGIRFAVWFQGCSLACPGCFNPKTHATERGNDLDVGALVSRIQSDADELDGVTVSGGEPFQQPDALWELVRSVRQQTLLSILVFTGYTRNELDGLPRGADVLGSIDVLISGRYDARARRGQDLVGSSNQELHLLTSRYGRSDFQSVPESELLIEPDGRVVLSGVGGFLLHGF